MSELIREALRHYERRSWWDEVNAHGRAQAEPRGIREEDASMPMSKANRHAQSKGSLQPRLPRGATDGRFRYCYKTVTAPRFRHSEHQPQDDKGVWGATCVP